MSPAILPILLVGALLLTAASGPRLIRSAAPALAEHPRVAVGLLSVGAAVWLIAFMALGPLFAWMVTGKTGRHPAGFCRQCLESSNPWAEPVFDTGVPTVIIMSGPALLTLIAAVAVAVRVASDRADAGRAAAQIRRRARPTTIRGHRVLVLDNDQAEAFTLGSRHGGIVLSTGALAVLDDAELDAVLAHERAHLKQRHHLVAMISHHVAQVFRPVPAITAAAAAIPLHLEIAADNAAREHNGTRALVSALLALRAAQDHSAGISSAPVSGALHAAGSDRYRALIGDRSSPRSRTNAIATSAQSAVLIVLSVTVAFPWITAMTSGCA